MSVPASSLAPAIDLDYTLDHKYTRREGRIYLSGVQALVRLPLMQQMRDRAAGHQHGRLHFRLSRLAARRLRSRAVEGEEAPEGLEHRVHAGPQRGPRRDHGLGHPADQPVPRRQVRRRVLDVVRQGARRRSLRRRVQARQCGRHLEVRRRARAGRGRPCLPLVDPAARLGTRIRLGDDADPQSGRRPGHPRHGHARLGHVALHRALGRLQDDRRNGRVLGLGQRQSAPARHPHARGFRAARGRPQHPLAGSAAEPGNAPAPAMPCRRRPRSPVPTASTASCSIRRRRGSASSPPARAISMCCRRSSTSASASATRARSASASTRSA